MPPKGCSRRTISQTQKSKPDSPRQGQRHGLGAGQGRLLPVPTHAPGKGKWCPGVKRDPTHTPRSYSLLRVRVRGQEMALDPESPIISRHVLCQSRGSPPARPQQFSGIAHQGRYAVSPVQPPPRRWNSAPCALRVTMTFMEIIQP